MVHRLPDGAKSLGAGSQPGQPALLARSSRSPQHHNGLALRRTCRFGDVT
jgi:hypothetical protein